MSGTASWRVSFEVVDPAIADFAPVASWNAESTWSGENPLDKFYVKHLGSNARIKLTCYASYYGDAILYDLKPGPMMTAQRAKELAESMTAAPSTADEPRACAWMPIEIIERLMARLSRVDWDHDQDRGDYRCTYCHSLPDDAHAPNCIPRHDAALREETMTALNKAPKS